VRGETVRDREFVVEYSRQVVDLGDCQIVFISHSEKTRLTEILSSLEEKAVLTVSEMEDFTRTGGNINFYLDGNKVRFEINPDTASSRGINISSQLLKLGKLITSRTNDWN
jgi:hypothetical protein